MSDIQLKIRSLGANAVLPQRGSEEAAGLDIYAAETKLIGSLCRKRISTEIAMEVPKGYFIRILPRSGLALKHGIDVFAGVIDSDYRGEVHVILFNSDDDDLIVHRGERIAQAVVIKYEHCEAVWAEQLSDSIRGDGGYGSTGR